MLGICFPATRPIVLKTYLNRKKYNWASFLKIEYVDENSVFYHFLDNFRRQGYCSGFAPPYTTRMLPVLRVIIFPEAMAPAHIIRVRFGLSLPESARNDENSCRRKLIFVYFVTFRLLCDFSSTFRRHKLFPTANASQSTASAHPQVRPVRLWMLVALIGGGIPVGPHNTHLSTKNQWISVSTKIMN